MEGDVIIIPLEDEEKPTEPAAPAAPVIVAAPAAVPDYTQQFIDLNDKINTVMSRIESNETFINERFDRVHERINELTPAPVDEAVIIEEVVTTPAEETPAEETTEIVPPAADSDTKSEKKKGKNFFAELLGGHYHEGNE